MNIYILILKIYIIDSIMTFYFVLFQSFLLLLVSLFVTINSSPKFVTSFHIIQSKNVHHYYGSNVVVNKQIIDEQQTITTRRDLYFCRTSSASCRHTTTTGSKLYAQNKKQTTPNMNHHVSLLRNANGNYNERLIGIIIDVENVRGKSGFRLSHTELIQRIHQYMNSKDVPHNSLYGKIILVVDHGQESSRIWLNDIGISIVFAGPNSYIKADDVIAMDIIPHLLTLTSTNTTTSSKKPGTIGVITADEQLIRRCLQCTSTITKQQQNTRRSSTTRGNRRRIMNSNMENEEEDSFSNNDDNDHQQAIVQIISPQSFLHELELLDIIDNNYDEQMNNENNEQEDVNSKKNQHDDDITANIILKEDENSNNIDDYSSFIIGSEILEMEYMLLQKHYNNRSQRKQLIFQRDNLVKRLEQQNQQQQQNNNGTSHEISNGANIDIVKVIIDTIADIHQYGMKSPLLNQLTHQQRNVLLSRLENTISLPPLASSSSQVKQDESSSSKRNNHRQSSKSRRKPLRLWKKESTNDRIILAEQLRLHLIKRPDAIISGTSTNSNTNTNLTQSNNDNDNNDFVYNHEWAAQSLISVPSKSSSFNYINQPLLYRTDMSDESLPTMTHAINDESNKRSSSSSSFETIESAIIPCSSSSLQIVVISDTHGMEEQLLQYCTKQYNNVNIKTHFIESNNYENNNNKNTIPYGDVLLHLGDFAIDRYGRSAERTSIQKFDRWLSYQPHPIKIVLRGNHDPRSYEFIQSRAIYITQPIMKTISNYNFAFVPYVSSSGLRNKRSIIPTSVSSRSCDVIVSHIPPYNIGLDRCITGKYAGSRTLRSCVEKMKNGTPFLWLCGHIHEGRGIVKDHRFGNRKKNNNQQGSSTMILNAANANYGIAQSIEYGPTILRLGNDDNNNNNDDKENDGDSHHIDNIIRNDAIIKKKSNHQVHVVEMDGQFTYMNHKYESFFKSHSKTIANKSQSSRKVLLSVDLGLRTGMCLFSDTGTLLHYDNFHFITKDDLRNHATKCIMEWENTLNQQQQQQQESDDANNDNNDIWRISHIAVEGHDAALQQLWRDIAIEFGNKSLLFVQPEEWRNDLLIANERRTGESSKIASTSIARQIINDYQDHHHHSSDTENSRKELFQSSSVMKLLNSNNSNNRIPLSLDNDDDSIYEDCQTDMAESILLGYHIARRLGWVDMRDPPIRRTSSGSVILPQRNTVQKIQMNELITL